MSFETTKIVRLLKELDNLDFADIIDMLETGDGEVLFFSADSGLIFRSSPGTCFIAVTGNDRESLYEHIIPSGLYSVHDDETADYMRRKLGFEGDEPCYLYVFTEDSIEDSPCDIRPLDESFIPIVLQHYDAGEEYIRERISSGNLFGAFIPESCLAGFAGFHSEGAMGMLEVMPEYRRHGIGEALERFLIKEALKRGHVPYCNVYISNEKSIRLQTKLGLKRGSRFSHWIRKSDLPEECTK